ncbi:unnamed protein product [Diamesa serratosioi]
MDLMFIVDVIWAIAMIVPLSLQTLYQQLTQKKKDVNGQLAFVTGAANGLGRGIAMKLAKHGMNIAIADVDVIKAESTANEIKKLYNVKAKAYKLDVSKVEEIIKIRDKVTQEMGPVDILINNAGLMTFNIFDEQTSEQIDKLIQVNVLGTILMSKCFLEQMVQNSRGHIVSISSMGGMHASPFTVIYCATKFAVTGFMQALSEYLRLKKLDKKITTTCILPMRFKMLEVDEAAEMTVDAILHNDKEASIPQSQRLFIRFVLMLPMSIQHFIRDRVMRESEFTDII